MKNLNQYITESRGWKISSKEIGQNFAYSNNKPFLWINTEAEEIGFVSEADIKSWSEDDEKSVKDILNLKPGEMYDSDGGINIYVRIK